MEEESSVHPNTRWQPWNHSTGPRSVDSKKRVSRNSYKHGFYNSVLRDFRKLHRSKSLRGLEKLFKALIYEDQPDKVIKIVDEIVKKSEAYQDEVDEGELTPEVVLEAVYLEALIIKVSNYKIVGGIRDFFDQMNQPAPKCS